MSRRAGALLVVLLLWLTGCGGDPGGVVRRATEGNDVDVSTPALRAARAASDLAPCTGTTAPAVTSDLPDLTLPCLGGGPPTQLRRLRGPLVVNLFAQWCGPCREELPRYAAFARKHAGTVGVLGVDWRDTQPSRALALAQESGVTYPVVADTAGRIPTANLLPRLILIDAKGQVAFSEAVVIDSVAQLEGLVEKHLGVPVG